MSFHESVEIEVSLAQEPPALQELEEETASLEYQRKQMEDRRILLDLERAELEQRLAELKLQYAQLDALSSRLDLQEAVLASDYEAVRMTGKRSHSQRSRTNENRSGPIS